MKKKCVIGRNVAFHEFAIIKTNLQDHKKTPKIDSFQFEVEIPPGHHSQKLIVFSLRWRSLLVTIYKIFLTRLMTRTMSKQVNILNVVQVIQNRLRKIHPLDLLKSNINQIMSKIKIHNPLMMP